MTETNEAYSDELHTHWRKWEVVDPRTLRLDLPHGSCSDMAGAIKQSKVLMPGVADIYVYAGGEPDILYRRTGKDWKAYCLRKTSLSR
jgi:hypothetical protein